MYNKLFAKIVNSSIWLESTTTRIVWVTFIAVMDEAGFVQFAAIGNVANTARVTVEEAQAAILCLESPDPESGDPENDGRRIERVPGGWMVLNAGKHREMVTRAIIQEQTRERVRRHREKLKRNGNAEVTPSLSLSHSDTTDHQKKERDARATPIISKRRAHAAWEGEKGLYVPQMKHQDFISLRNHPGAEAELFIWYETVAETWQGSPGADMLKFWTARFDEQWPAPSTAKPKPWANWKPKEDRS